MINVKHYQTQTVPGIKGLTEESTKRKSLKQSCNKDGNYFLIIDKTQKKSSKLQLIMSSHRHFILHKPYGYLSQLINNQTRRKNKKLLGELYNFPDGTMAIGRLDETSEGLLLMTTDGKVSEQIRSKKVEKEYYAQVDGLISDEAIEQLQKGVEIGFDGKKYITKPCTAIRLESANNIPMAVRHVRDERHGTMSWVSITLTEGKFRQVRKMTAAVGHPTLRLVRVRIGNIHLNIESGKVEEMLSLTKY